jgi:hypothetical protein
MKEIKMKKRILILIFLLFIALLAATTVQASPPQYFYLEKTCDLANSCLLHDATPPFDILNGGRIYYLDHAYFGNPAGIWKESAAVLLTSEDGQHSLLGSVSWVLRDENFRGRYTISKGTGDLEGVHASGKVEVVSWDDGIFSLTGTYHIEP